MSTWDELTAWLDRADEWQHPEDIVLPDGRVIPTGGDPYAIRLMAMLRGVLAGHGPVEVPISGGSAPHTPTYMTRCKCNVNVWSPWPCWTVRQVLEVPLGPDPSMDEKDS